ncbi:hypothetical protein RCH33_1337 [Flavobacterium daejeonense]|nr:hypothetical protein RCH33_1337 [Flavobacterium daejeonense]
MKKIKLLIALLLSISSVGQKNDTSSKKELISITSTQKTIYENVNFYQAKTYSKFSKNKKSLFILTQSLKRIEHVDNNKKDKDSIYKNFIYELTIKIYQDRILKDSVIKKIRPNDLNELIDKIENYISTKEFQTKQEITNQNLIIKAEESWFGITIHTYDFIPPPTKIMIFQDLELDTRGGYLGKVYKDDLFIIKGDLVETNSIDRFFKRQKTYDFNLKVYRNKILLKTFTQKSSSFPYDSIDNIIESNPLLDEARLYIINDIQNLKP